MCVCIYIYIYIYTHVGGLKSLYDDVISIVDDVFNQRDPSTATLMEKVCESQGDPVEK